MTAINNMNDYNRHINTQIERINSGEIAKRYGKIDPFRYDDRTIIEIDC
jgi:hypothetical protein